MKWKILNLKKGLGGNDSEDGDTKDKDDEAERERLEAIKEAEDRRKEKHRKMEAERENMRQDIRDKVITNSSYPPYNIYRLKYYYNQ